eukprot:c24962_g4_i1 orf=1-642(+)
MPSSDFSAVWYVLLGACRKWGDIRVARWAFEQAVQVDKCVAAPYVCMASIYAAAGMQEQVDKVEAFRMKHGAWRIPGHCWWTDVSRNVHLFTTGDESHPQSKCLYAKLEDISQKLQMEEFFPCWPWVSLANLDNEKEDMLCRHSERLAIAYALINTPEGTPIRVTKNMRACRFCHFATSLISKMEKRKIQVIDANRIHIFEDGKCVCEDYGWW